MTHSLCSWQRRAPNRLECARRPPTNLVPRRRARTRQRCESAWPSTSTPTGSSTNGCRPRKVLERIDVFAAELNASLAAPRSRHTPQSIAPAIDRRLRQDALLEAIEIRITEQAVAGRTRYHVALSLDEAEWARRRRYDGFTVLVAHPDLTQNATDLCRLYRAKDAVEKDFHVIKSVVELRPVRHRNDGKVRAHVTLCMLALLLERTLQCRLASHSTAEAALELLESCHLNRYAGKDGATAAYTVTAPDAEQLKLLRTLRLQHLVDDESLADRMTPR
jgi:hypothetical protein